MTVVVPARQGARRAVALAAALLLVALVLVATVLLAPSASAAPTDPTAPTAPVDPTAPDGGSSFSVEINGPNGEPSSSLVTLVGITLLSLAPTLLLMMTSFTKIFVVLSLTRNALGTGTVPPNMVLAGLALFLSMFIMWPVFGEINDAAVQPYLEGATTFSQALDAGSQPLREFMLAHTREEDLALMTRAADLDNPATMADVPLTTLVPAFVISELRAAFIIGFVIFVPFLVIDLVVAAALMSMGMMMLPPTMISLPFKLLLFVLVDGWGLITTSLIGSYGVG
ncbi:MULTISPECIES: flagellar type III secretion system pore protein FliP [Oerskovia]|uniref:Flagellar biosynthetic protein FliP n=1 Tax=Oerskovia rustica TaxID=2762237 RepID=A0ABR8RUD9_9CELL|nr:flagellar type III secretion system pore protein FliP [Oerskovia rustica]MBD7951383.1 flagellar type III secretion system pore protein FliP [Oerskovia rustica]